MKHSDLTDRLREFANKADEMAEQYELVKQIEDGELGIEAVEPILRFFEDHEDLDMGAPGPLVHYVEKFYKAGYEERLLRSLDRKPTLKTLEMLNRLINGTDEPPLRQRYVAVCERAAHSDLATFQTKEEAFRLLARYENFRTD